MQKKKAAKIIGVIWLLCLYLEVDLQQVQFQQ